MALTLEEQLALARARARKRAAEAQAEGLKPWELARKQQDEVELKPWERAKREQEAAGREASEHDIDEQFLWARARKRKAEAEQGQASESDLKPWARAKLEQEEALALVRARARARMTQAQEGTSEARVQSEFEAMSPLHKAGRATMDIARLGLDGATFGYGDKLLAGIEAAGRPDMDYDEALRLHRQATGDAKARAGLAGTVTEIGAGVLPMSAAANAGLSAARLVPQGLSRAKALGAKLIAGGVEGAGYGALHGAGHDQDVGDAASIGALAGIGGTAAAQTVGGVTRRLAQLLKKKPKVPLTEELAAQPQAADRVAKSEAVESVLRDAELTANPERATRTLISRLPQAMKNLTPDELAAINDIARGSLSRNATRLTGDLLAPQGPLGGASVAGAVSGLFAGYPSAVAAPLVGAGAKMLSDRLTKRKANRLAELMRAGGTKEALTGPDNAAQRLAETQREALARLLLSGELSLAPYAVGQD
jgi:hypothetical protein